jgi:lipoprotein-anchoring transpeptidase ErfK/SrfK
VRRWIALVALPAALGMPSAAAAQDLVAKLPPRGEPGPVRGIAPTPRRGAVTAKLLANVRVYRRSTSHRPIATLASRTTYTRSGTRLLVVGAHYGQDGRLRLKAIVPLRPTNRPAWIRADKVRLMQNRWFVRIDRARRLVSVYRDGRVVRRFRAVVGAPGTPTPRGLAALLEEVPAADPTIFTGPWSLHLTAFSRVLDRFGAGDGRIAVHGRGPASLGDPLGTARSHGCVRIDNGRVRYLQRALPLGTPVRIV